MNLIIPKQTNPGSLQPALSRTKPQSQATRAQRQEGNLPKHFTLHFTNPTARLLLYLLPDRAGRNYAGHNNQRAVYCSQADFVMRAKTCNAIGKCKAKQSKATDTSDSRRVDLTLALTAKHRAHGLLTRMRNPPSSSEITN
jgi:hypothetical protein